jgi:hypothetical protein
MKKMRMECVNNRKMKGKERKALFVSSTEKNLENTLRSVS